MKTILTASAALAALSFSSLALAQAVAFNVETATAMPGQWAYRSTPAATEAVFANAGQVRVTLRCNRAVRTVSIIRTGVPAAAPTMAVWTTSLSRSVPARFNLPGTLTADLAATDPLLDAIALSRGKFATSALGAPTAVYPLWADPARVIEDCRI